MMKAARLKEPGIVELDEIARPEPGEGEVLLRVLAAGVCRTDCHIRNHPFATPPGTTLGHEIAGEIVEIGGGVTGWRPGARVVVHPCWACHNCPQCRAGRENYCQGHGAGRVPPPTPGVTMNGGMADYAVVPASSILPIGDLDPAFAAVLADAGLAPYHSVRLLRDRLSPGSLAIVIGLGGLGQFAVQMLKAMTPARVAALDIADAALRAAVAAGADDALRADAADIVDRLLALTGGRGADAVIDFVGSDASLRLAAATIAPFGAIQAVGLTGGSLPFEAADISTVRLPWGVTLMKPYSGTYRDLADVIALAREGRLEPRLTRFPLEQAVAALDRLEGGEISGRAVLIPG
ncbi:alcohol dehydrogenase catalytic domain-containing protein [Tsuneonella sp. CC-YZS046]|uniref:alcohol dehydrogenase catalytic domain-containing protein n=1 Tax=Tsuneonella sp. CC-YZS046 TaxID=3042152 RepID=UPI002D796E10|nr:alcohol dehydrogenase catalytic domain-containing protein [Tsuneonella sp. CC-YZS046]WRO65335.1 alcohol dehydrogenase catalytic domain-containing protein [Tsuneonella sp. CC-YZS046]